MNTRWLFGTWLFLFLVTLYNINLDFLPGDDATPNLYLPLTVLEHGALTFSPKERPFMFVWNRRHVSNEVKSEISIDGWLPQVKGWPESIGYYLDELNLKNERYYLIPSIREGEYLSTFGIGAGLFALPLFASVNLVVDINSRSAYLPWYLGKVAASFAVAGSAVFIFLTAVRFCTLTPAVLITLAYGLGTCVWSISSQTLWQHGPNEFFLAAACYFCTKSAPAKRDWCLCGFALALAVLCRPTSAVVVLTMGAWLLFKRRDALPSFLCGGLPIAFLLSLYNWHFLGNPIAFGQMERGHSVALEKTGSAELWSTPLFEGLSGLLVSPSRGLLVYSPFLVFALFGILRIWRHREYAVLRPLTLAFVCMTLVAAKWFDWWGGWTYGYRPIVDAMPLLILFLAPMISWIETSRWRKVLFSVFLSWSFLLQFVGAFAYDLISWHKVGGMNIDRPEYRYRLWSWKECEIVYYMTHFSESRARRPRW